MNTRINDYEQLRVKGQGVFAYVLGAYDKTKDKKVAKKKTPKIRVKECREYKILSMIKDCQYVIQLLDTFYTTNKKENCHKILYLNIFQEDLININKDFFGKEHISIEKIKLLIRQILLGLDYYLKRKIVIGISNRIIFF